MDQDILRQIGLTGNESKLYLYLVFKKSAVTTGPIIIDTKIPRSKVYELLEKLSDKGLVSQTILNGVKHFEATSPEKILDYINKRAESIKELEKQAKDFVNDLKKQRFKDKSFSAIKKYSGREGIKAYYLNLVEQIGKDEEYCGFNFNKECLNHKNLLYAMDHIHRERAKGKTMIISSPSDKVNLGRLNKDKIYSYKKSKFPTISDVSVFKDSVVFYEWGEEPVVYEIRSKYLSGVFKKYFQEVWEKSKN